MKNFRGDTETQQKENVCDEIPFRFTTNEERAEFCATDMTDIRLNHMMSQDGCSRKGAQNKYKESCKLQPYMYYAKPDEDCEKTYGSDGGTWVKYLNQSKDFEEESSEHGPEWIRQRRWGCKRVNRDVVRSAREMTRGDCICRVLEYLESHGDLKEFFDEFTRTDTTWQGLSESLIDSTYTHKDRNGRVEARNLTTRECIIRLCERKDFDDEDSSEEDSCPICMEKMCESTKVIEQLDCGHRFHFECINRWRNTIPNARCPMCRRDTVHQDLIDDIVDSIQSPQSSHRENVRSRVMALYNAIVILPRFAISSLLNFCLYVLECPRICSYGGMVGVGRLMMVLDAVPVGESLYSLTAIVAAMDLFCNICLVLGIVDPEDDENTSLELVFRVLAVILNVVGANDDDY